MTFEFQVRQSGGGGHRKPEPEHAAIRITRHKEGKDKRNCYRFYFCLNQKSVQLARLIPGDRLTVGFNAKTRQIAIKRDNVNGFSVSGSAMKKGRGNAAFQLALETDNELCVEVLRNLGEWISVSEEDGLLIADI